MYLEFFKFKKDPFDITPDPDFLFLSPSHKEASASIFYGIESRKGFVAVTGEVGLGKTTILRSYLEGTDPEKIRIVYIFNSAVSFDKLLKQICSDLGIQAAYEDQTELIDILFYYLIEEYGKDHNVVLIIDEAQNMPVETLERLRVLTNLETSQDKLIQIILSGQPELDAKLDLPELRHLKQRVAIWSRIDPLTPDESIAYIYHRLMRASSFHNPVFTKKAMKLIIKQAEGVPRTINILCDNALVTAFGYLRKPVDEKIVKEVIRDFRRKQHRFGFRWKIVLASAVVACLALAVFVPANVISRFQIPLMSNRSVSVKPADPAAAGAKAGQSRVVSLEKKAPAVTAVKRDARMAVKHNATPTVSGPKVPTSNGPESKTGLTAAPALSTVASSSKGKPVPTASQSLAQKTIEGKTESTAAPVPPSVVSSSKGKPVPTAGQSLAQKTPEGKTDSTAAPVPPSVASSTKGKPAPTASQSFAQEAPETLSPPADAAPSNTPVALAPGLNGKALPPVVVKKGDNVSKLLVGVYGRVDDDMLKSFKELNPGVKNINRLLVGEKIFLPRVGAGKQ